MAEVIRFILSNVPAIMFVAAILIAVLRRNGSLATRLLDWMLLLAIGVTWLWAGVFHVLFPEIAARSIGWEVSPFQFEIGVADIAIGIVAILSFWQRRPFKAAVVGYIVLFNIGVAIGHVRQAVEAGDFAANNFGLLLILTIALIFILPILLWLSEPSGAARGRPVRR